MYVAPTHDLARQVQQNLQAMGVKTHYWRQGPDEQDECPEEDLVGFFRGLGYVIRWGPCLTCPKQKTCSYRRVFTCGANRSAQVLIISSWHLRRSDLWNLKALQDRPLVVLDEDAMSALTAPVELNVEQLQQFNLNLQSLRDRLGGGSDSDAWLLRRQQRPAEGKEAALALTDILRRTALDILRACSTAGYGLWQQSESIVRQDMTTYDQMLVNDDGIFSDMARSAYDVARSRTVLPNILSNLRELLGEARPLHLTSGACRWTRKPWLPAGQILLLDATGEPAVIEGVLGRPVEVIDTPAVEQKAEIFQIMDKVGTRAGNRRDLEREDSWTAKLVTEVGRKHKGQRLLCVTFKQDAERLGSILAREHGNATVVHYGALRGLNAFESFEVGLIIGRPMPNEAHLQLLAVAAFGPEALDEELRSPPLEWQLYTHDIGPDTWTVRCQQYADERWQAVWRHVVTGELVQAIGRLRPLTNACVIYVATNEPLPATLDTTPMFAGELFANMAASSRRRDFRRRVDEYARTMANLEAAGTAPTNTAVCDQMHIKPPNGLRYRRLVLEILKTTPPVEPIPAKDINAVNDTS